MAEWGERTAEEREAARLERERRRLQSDDGAELLEDPEIASGTRRVARSERPSPARERPRRTRTKKPHSRFGRVLSLLALIVAAALIWFLVELFQPFHGSGHGSVTVTIPPHSSSSQVGKLLERDGVISSRFFFELRATLAGERGALRSGTYHLKLDMSYGQVLKILTMPPPQAKVTELTIVEGRTRREIDRLLRSQGIRGSYLADTRRSPVLNPASYGAPRHTSSLEGFLFPSTYQLRVPVSIPVLVADQLSTFRKRFAMVNLSYARRRRLTPYDVLIVASLVEAEAETVYDRPLIASVIYNRLARGMPLQIDATVRFAVDNYTRPITNSQLRSPSPWNTYVHKGLPPTPIDSPGSSAIAAAAHPASTNFLFFVVKPCGNGSHAFASTYPQFLQEEGQYNSARTRQGGRSPVHC